MQKKTLFVILITVITISLCIGCSEVVTEESFEDLADVVFEHDEDIKDLKKKVNNGTEDGGQAKELENSITELTKEIDALKDMNEIEDVIRTYARAMDDLDKETWLNVFSDGLVSYMVYPFGDDTPVLEIPMSGAEGTAKQQLMGMCDMMVFERVAQAMTVLTNIEVEITGDGTATCEDTFRHWEVVNPDHPANQMQGMDGDHRYFQEGRHQYEFAKEDGEWKMTKMQGTIYASDSRELETIVEGQ